RAMEHADTPRARWALTGQPNLTNLSESRSTGKGTSTSPTSRMSGFARSHGSLYRPRQMRGKVGDRHRRLLPGGKLLHLHRATLDLALADDDREARAEAIGTRQLLADGRRLERHLHRYPGRPARLCQSPGLRRHHVAVNPHEEPWHPSRRRL